MQLPLSESKRTLLLILLGIAALCLALNFLDAAPASQNGETAADLAGAGRQLIVLEAEDCSITQPPLRKTQRSDASAQACLGVEEGAGKAPQTEGAASLPIEIAHHGRYRLWLRAWWSDACGNSVAASFNDDAPRLLGNDGTYAAWHWVQGPVRELQPGKHVLILRHREDNIELDQILLVNDDRFTPQGALVVTSPAAPQVATQSPTPADTPGEQPEDKNSPHARKLEIAQSTPHHGANEPQLSQNPETPASASADFVPPSDHSSLANPGSSILVGLAGAYRDGFEGHLVQLGVPYVRLREDEICDQEKLKHIVVLLLSGPRGIDSGAIYRALYAFLKSGRTVVMEILPEHYSRGDDPDDLFFQHSGQRNFTGVTVLADDSPFFKGAPKSWSFGADVTCNWLPLTTDRPGAKIYGAQTVEGSRQKHAGALLVRELHGGKLYYLAAAAAFNAMWRGRKVDPYLINVLRQAIGPRCRFPFASLQYAAQQNWKVNFSDDFMRKRGESGGWKVLEGVFGLTGPIKDAHTTFSVNGMGTAFAAVGNDTWQNYRVAASVLPGSGEAGIWQTTPGGGRLTLRLRKDGKTVVLTHRTPAGEEVLGQALVPEDPKRWRRLALFRRGEMTEAYLDGKRALSLKDAPAASGRCGVCVIDGDAHFDDFRAIDVAALSPGREVAPGEEGSERCMVRYFQRCSEKLSIYSPQWLFKPQPFDQSVLELALPLFKGGTLQIDEQAPRRILASDRLPLVKLDVLPSTEVTVHTPYWRDYHFSGRVTDWRASSGEWAMINRWSCDPEYEWYGGHARSEAALWFKHRLEGAVGLEVLMAPRADKAYGEERGHDLNLIVCGNGKDLTQGYQFVVLDAGRGCQVLKNGKVLGSRQSAGLSSGHSLHHPWFSVAAIVSGKKLSFYFDRQLVVACEDPEPLGGGQIGIWTRNNKISVARATLSLSQELEENQK